MDFMTILFILTGALCMFSAVENKSIADYGRQYLGSSGTGSG